MNPYAQVINKYRIDLGSSTRFLSYDKLAEQIRQQRKITTTAIYKWASGKSVPQQSTLESLAACEGWVGQFGRDMLAVKSRTDADLKKRNQEV